MTDTIAGWAGGRGRPGAQWRGWISTDDTVRDAASSRARAAIHSESARQQATPAAAAAAIRRPRRAGPPKRRRPALPLATNGMRPPGKRVAR